MYAVAQATDWPNYRGGNEHRGSSSDQLAMPLVVHWEYTAPAKPRKGWSGEDGKAFERKIIMERVKFDDALHVAIADGRLYFGSSVDHQVHCRRADTGETIWTFFTGGPVRLAPTIAGGRVYFGSDDGFVYCLEAGTGKLVWKLRAGPDDEWMLARGEMISRWPIRTGVLVDDGTAYFGAGLFPHEEVYLYAVDASDGRIEWRRDNISHGDAGRNDLSPQGYLLATDELLIVPSGRSLPAAIDRRTGDLVHKRTHGGATAGGVVGGTESLLADGQIYSWGAHHIFAMEQKSGDTGFGYFDGRQMAVAGDAAYIANGARLSRLDRLAYAAGSRKRNALDVKIAAETRSARASGAAGDEARARLKQLLEERATLGEEGVTWSVPEASESSLIVAGNSVIVGGRDTVAAYNADTGQKFWSAPVAGEARGLAAADGRLYVSTTSGQIVCFGGESTKPGIEAQTPVANPYPQDEKAKLYAEAADEILKRSGVNAGFCLVVGNEQGQLAYEIARRSDLRVYAIDSNEANVNEARQILWSAGYYGHRVTVHHADFSELPYSSYFANLIVSDTLLVQDELPTVAPAAVARHLKPLGGAMCLGRPQNAIATAVSIDKLTDWLTRTELGDQAKITAEGSWAILTRGALPGAGNWTHQYGDAGNTATSQEQRLRGGLGVLWFGDPGPTMMVNRHDGAVGPLALHGRLVVQGDETVVAYDAYNGQFLWEFKNPDAVRTGVYLNQNPGNLAASDTSVFMFAGKQCFEIDLNTGEPRRIHQLPPGADEKTHEWGYVAYRDGLLFGTATTRAEVEAARRRRGKRTEDATDLIFCIDVANGQHLWQFQGTSISHHTVALGPGRVYFIDSLITPDQRAALLREDKTPLKDLSPEDAKKEEERLKSADVRLAVALDSRTGNQAWAVPVDVTDCSEIGTGGGKLTLLYDKNVLLLCGANANGHYWQQFMAGEFKRRRLVALSADGGRLLWHKDANYRHRPIIVGQQVIAEPWSFDLYTGNQLMRPNAVTDEPEPWSIMRTGHHCGMITGCESMLFFRSGYTGFYDLTSDVGVQHFAGHRLGCWINAVPANGLVMIPEAGAGCVCLFSIESTVVFEPREPRRPWAISSSVGAMTPVKHLAINFGAPGDRRDARGTVWLTYPRPKPYKETSLETKLALETRLLEKGGFSAINEESNPIAGAVTPWVFTSWVRGMSQCTIPLRGPEDMPADYDVTLYFTDVENDAAGSRMFDVKVQGREAAQSLDIIAESGGRSRSLVRRVQGVNVVDKLTIELASKSPDARSEQMPILCAIEISISSGKTSEPGATEKAGKQ
jgi:outer membrane protein assembly factor BamB/ubiquinone/menaquinone biosynthesis C-methylase UbiE